MPDEILSIVRSLVMRTPDLRIAYRLARAHVRRRASSFGLSLEEAYKVLGLAPGADEAEVKSAYRRLAREYHPDRAGDSPEVLQQIQRINAARAVIEAGEDAGHRYEPASEPYDDTYWQHFRTQYGPKPSGHYGDSDLRRLAEAVLDKGLLQVMLRAQVPWVPVDAGIPRGGAWSYYRPFGSKTRTQRIPPDTTLDKLADQIRNLVRGKLFDLVIKDREAWVTWEANDGRHYQSVSFEVVKAPVKKDPGAGMTPQQIDDHLRREGLAVVAGGTKFSYWGPRGHTPKTGVFIRQAAKTLRVVARRQVDQGYKKEIVDNPLANEVYFGQLKPETLTKWVEFVKRKNTQPT